MILVDAHAHLHGCFSVEPFLDAAAQNISKAVWRTGSPDVTPGMLLFTQSASDDTLGGLRPGSVGHWLLTATQESISLKAHGAGKAALILVAGRQIATAEGLEVLALGTPGPFTDGNSLEDTVKSVLAQGGTPVIPWGFGKWWRSRGGIVRRALADRTRFPVLFLGDNAGRPRILPRPGLFSEAERQGRAVLPGTDPLPFPAEQGKAGRLVFRAECNGDAEKPFAEFQNWLMCRQTSPAADGVYERAGVFLRRQVAMQLHRQRGAQGT